MTLLYYKNKKESALNISKHLKKTNRLVKSVSNSFSNCFLIFFVDRLSRSAPFKMPSDKKEIKLHIKCNQNYYIHLQK